MSDRWTAILRDRAERVMSEIAKMEVDGLIVFAPAMTRWLGHDASALLWIDNKQRAFVKLDDIGSLPAVADLAVVGSVPAEHVPAVAAHSGRLRDATDACRAARRVKEPLELALCRRAAGATRDAFLAAEWTTVPTQQKLAQSLLNGIWNSGGDGWAYDPSIAVDSETSVVWSMPSRVSMDGVERLVIDAAAECRGYKADCTVTLERTRSPEYSGLTEVMRELTQEIAEGLRSCAEIAALGDRLLDAKGFPPLPHALGHGVGVELHEHPYLTKSSDHILGPGDVFMIEPAYYFTDTGARIESMFTIDAAGHLVTLLDGIALGSSIEGYWTKNEI